MFCFHSIHPSVTMKQWLNSKKRQSVNVTMSLFLTHMCAWVRACDLWLSLFPNHCRYNLYERSYSFIIWSHNRYDNHMLIALFVNGFTLPFNVRFEIIASSRNQQHRQQLQNGVNPRGFLQKSNKQILTVYSFRCEYCGWIRRKTLKKRWIFFMKEPSSAFTMQELTYIESAVSIHFCRVKC